MKTPCSRYWGVRSASVLPSDHNKAARYSRCRRYRSGKMMTVLLRWRKNPGLACTPESRHKPGNGRSWSGYADIFQDQRYPRNGFY